MVPIRAAPRAARAWQAVAPDFSQTSRRTAEASALRAALRSADGVRRSIAFVRTNPGCMLVAAKAVGAIDPLGPWLAGGRQITEATAPAGSAPLRIL